MDGNWTRPVAEAEAAGIVADINQRGYGTIRNYVSDEELEPVRAIARAAVRAAGGEYACLTGTDGLAGTVLSELPRSVSFKNLCRRLYELGTGANAPEVRFHQVFRCLQGATGQRHSDQFHYDSYVLTALLPVAIPEEGAPGDLVVFPSTRPIRRHYLSNMLDKALIDSRIAQNILWMATRRRKLNTIAIRMRPGTMYFFWGYRSIHTNEPCDPDKLRATALFHYGDPHQDSRAKALIGRARRLARA